MRSGHASRERRGPTTSLIEVKVKMIGFPPSLNSRCLTLAAAGRSGVCGVVGSSGAGEGSPVAAPQSMIWPSVASPVPREPLMEARIADLLRHLTLEQKVAQMVQADIRYVTPEDVRTYRLGSILNGGGAFPAPPKYSQLSDWAPLPDPHHPPP